MISSLPMYAHPPHLLDEYWDLIRASAGFGPRKRVQPTDLLAHWRAPDLMLSQTCGLPFRAKLHDHVQLIGTPDYGLADCPAGYYNSVILAKDGATWGDRLAFNEPLSQSGWAAFWAYCQTTSAAMPRHMVQTGSHAASVAAVAESRADICAIDAVTFRLMQHADQIPPSLTIIARTAPTPGLPYITAPAQDARHIATAIDTALGDIGPALGIKSLVRIPKAAYLEMPVPPAPPS